MWWSETAGIETDHVVKCETHSITHSATHSVSNSLSQRFIQPETHSTGNRSLGIHSLNRNLSLGIKRADRQPDLKHTIPEGCLGAFGGHCTGQGNYTGY